MMGSFRAQRPVQKLSTHMRSVEVSHSAVKMMAVMAASLCLAGAFRAPRVLRAAVMVSAGGLRPLSRALPVAMWRGVPFQVSVNRGQRVHADVLAGR